MDGAEQRQPFDNDGDITNGKTEISSYGNSEISQASAVRRKISLNSFLRPSRAYLAEYTVALIVTGTILSLINSMFGSVIDYLGSNNTSPRFGGDFAYTASIATLAGVIVLVPTLIYLTKRTALAESENPSASKLSWRKAFLAIFLVLVMLTTICYSVAFVYEVLSRIASTGLGTASKQQVWRPLVKYGFAILLFGFTAWLYAHDYRAEKDSNSRHQLWRRIHRYALSLL